MIRLLKLEKPKALMQLPLFPLSSVVMPGGLMPLRIFEPRYIDMVGNCFKTDTGFGVCLIKEGGEIGEPSVPYPVGTLARIVDFDQGADGLLQITAKGDQEFRVLTHAANDAKLIIAEVELLDERPPTPMSKQAEDLASKLDLILSYIDTETRFEEKELDNPDWVCFRLLELLPLEPKAKYEILQMPSNAERLKSLSALQIEIAEKK